MNPNPEIFKHIELMLGSIGFIIALFFGLFLFTTRNQRAVSTIFLAIYLLAFSLRIGKSLFYNYFPIHPIARNVFLGMLLAIGPSLWFYVRYSSKPEIVIQKRKIYFNYIPLFLFIGLCWIIPNDSSSLSRMIFIGLLLHVLGYGLFTLYSLIYRYVKPSDEKSRQTKNWLLYFTILTIAMALVQIGVFMSLVPYLSTAFLFSVVILFLSVWALKTPFLFKTNKERYSNSGLSNEKAIEYLNQLNDIMLTEKLYLDPDLTLTKLSANLGITSKQLSQVINQVKNENYSQYITSYRIDEAKRLLMMKEYEHYKISAIAYESGFNSISSFNSAFKKLTNITAIEYRKSQKE